MGLDRRETNEPGSVGIPGWANGEKRSEGVSFFVIGTPAPQGSKRHVGNGRMIESSTAVGPWRAAVGWTAASAASSTILGPVAVTIVFYLKRPPSAPKSRTHPDRKPDLDKLIRSTLDGLTESGVIEDDARVIRVTASKIYAEPGHPTGAEINIERVTA